MSGNIRVHVWLDPREYDRLYRRVGNKKHGLTRYLREAVNEKLEREQPQTEAAE